MKAIDLFSGVGGMSLGFKRSGVDVKLAIDYDRRHVESYNANFEGDRGIQYDISKVDEKFLSDNLSDSVDLVFGGPPCQGFSVGGKQNLEDERNSLIYSFLNVVKIVQPKVFVLENVAGLLQNNYKPILSKFYKKARQLGYKLNDVPLLLNAKDFNVPQNRKRVFIIGYRNGKDLLKLEMIKPIFNQSNLQNPTVYDAISELKIFDNQLNSKEDRLYANLKPKTAYSKAINGFKIDRNYFKKSISRSIKKGVGGFMITDHSNEVKSRFLNTSVGQREKISRYYKLDWAGIAPTLRAGTIAGRGQFMASRPIHPDEPRCISVREAARLHSYPDYFEFYPTKWYGNMQIGNSVPPLLAQAVAGAVVDHIN